MYRVTSEIYEEACGQPAETADGKILSTFRFRNPYSPDPACVPTHDSDGDLILTRKRSFFNSQLLIQHYGATELKLVGLQVWRGAFLLADYLYHQRAELAQLKLLELGSGVGLTSIAAAVIGLQVVCTDVDIGGLLTLIRANVQHNRALLQGNIKVLEYNFMQPRHEYGAELLEAIDSCDLVAAADVIYDDTLSDAFIAVIENIFEREAITGRGKTVLVALEKRFVFTLNELEAVPPMFEYFLRQLDCKSWRLVYLPIDFPQYFEYARCEQLVLFKITSGQNFHV